MTKKKSLVRVISLCLILALMLGGMPVVALDNATAATTTAPADTAARTVTEAALPDAEESLLGPGELSYAALQTAVLAPTDIPDALPAGAVEAKGHVNRVYEQEVGLSHLLFQNRDGGKTAYFYGTPIKYVAADGSVRDKSKTLIAVNKTYGALGYDYGVEDNSFRQYYAQNPATGVLLELGEGSVRIIPQPLGSLVVPRGVLRENTFVYNHIFGNTTALVYTPQLSGVKEDIVLRSFAGVSDFSFTYRTSGLSLIELDGTYTLVDESGFPQATLGAVVLIDAEGKRAGGSLTVTETANGTYTVTIHADRAFLTNPSTVYPVTVDPSIDEISINNAGEAAILDYGLYSGSIPADANIANYFGYVNSSSVGRVIYKFPYFIKGSTASVHYTHLNQYQISQAFLYICGYAVDDYPGTDVTAYPVTTSWSSSTNAFTNATLFNSCKNGTPNKRSALYFDDSYSGIDLTAIFKAWAAYNSGDTSKPNPANGVVLVDTNETNTGYLKKVRATEQIREDVFMWIDYSNYGGEFFLSNANEGGMLQRNGSLVTVDEYQNSTPDLCKWQIESVLNGYHVIRSVADQTKYLYSWGTSITTTAYDKLSLVPHEAKWIVSSGTTPDSYVFKNVATGKVLYSDGVNISTVAEKTTSATDYYNTVWHTTTTNNFTPLQSITFDKVVTYMRPGTTAQFAIAASPKNATKSESKYFKWSLDNNNFSLSSAYVLTAPAYSGITTLTIKHIITGKQVTKTVKCGVLRDDTYWIENAGIEKFMDAGEAIAAGREVYPQNMHEGDSQKWILTMHANGTYYIQAFTDGSYLTAEETVDQTGYRIVLSDTPGEASKWYISLVEDGIYRIRSATVTAGIVVGSETDDENETASFIQKAYSWGDENGHWYIYSQLCPIVNLYDGSLVGNVPLLNGIIEANNFAKNVYRKLGIYFYMEGNPTYYAEATTNGCPVGSMNPCTEEKCGSNAQCSSLHHKNPHRLMQQLENQYPREAGHVYVVWTDRDEGVYCTYKDQEHQAFTTDTGMPYGFTINAQPMIVITRIADQSYSGNIYNDIVVQACMSISLAHELAHTLGMHDVYNESDHNNKTGSCIMDAAQDLPMAEHYTLLVNGEEDVYAFCDSCSSTLKNCVLNPPMWTWFVRGSGI